jgi:hypothetical protein
MSRKNQAISWFHGVDTADRVLAGCHSSNDTTEDRPSRCRYLWLILFLVFSVSLRLSG